MSTHKARFNAGDTIDGRYEVIQMLASGGMGELYKVRHVHLGDFRVVKVLKSRLLSDDTTKQRFLREAKLAASIKNPYLASLFDFSSLADGSYYMVMEYIAGVTLAERIRAGEHFELPFILRVGEQVLSGLSALHHAGIIHRDISPDNLMLTEINGAPSIKIIDLGIAKPAEGGEGLTSDGFFVGKLHYASPEQAGMLEPDQKLDQRTDLYSLGVVLYEMATERMPFSAESPQTYFLKQVSEEVQPINPAGGMPKIPYDAEQFILKLLKRDRSERFADAEDALASLAKLTGGLPPLRGNTGDIPLQPPAKPLELDLPPTRSQSGPTPLGGGGSVPLGGSTPSRPTTPPQTARPNTDPGALSEMIPETVIFDPKSLPDLGSAAGDEDATVFSDSLEPSASVKQGPKRKDRITEELPLVVPPSASPSQPAPYGGDEDMTVTSAPEPEPVYAPDRTVVQSFPEPEPAPSAFGSSAGSSLADEILRRGQGSGSHPTTPVRTELPPPPPATIVESFADMGMNRPAMKSEPAPEPDLSGRTVVEPYNTGVAAGYQQGAMPPPPPVLPPRPKKKSSAMPIILGLVVLALLAAAAFAAWRFMAARNASPAPTATVADSTQPVVPPPPATTTPTPVQIQTPPPMNDFGTLTGTMPPNVVPSVTPMPTFTPLAGPTTAPTPRKKKEVKKPTPTPRPQATVAPTAAPVATPVPPSVREGELVTPGPGVVDARITRWSPPSYPKAAERLRAAGTSEMTVLIDENGSPQDVKIVKSSGFAPLDEEAQRVARKSSYKAATKQGVKVKMWIPVKVTFTRP